MQDSSIGQDIIDKFSELKKIGFLCNVLELIFCNFSSGTKHFGIFLKFPNLPKILLKVGFLPSKNAGFICFFENKKRF